MPEESRLAYEFALELAGQLITLSTGILALTIAFSKDIFKRIPHRLALVVLVASWTVYLSSIWFGVRHVQALTGSLEWAALEQARLPDDVTLANAAAVYLAETSLPAEAAAARETLSRAGLLIGDSAKRDAAWQIRLFFFATILVMVYGLAMLLFTPPGLPDAGNEGPVDPIVESPLRKRFHADPTPDEGTSADRQVDPAVPPVGGYPTHDGAGLAGIGSRIKGYLGGMATGGHSPRPEIPGGLSTSRSLGGRSMAQMCDGRAGKE